MVRIWKNKIIADVICPVFKKVFDKRKNKKATVKSLKQGFYKEKSPSNRTQMVQIWKVIMMAALLGLEPRTP